MIFSISPKQKKVTIWSRTKYLTSSPVSERRQIPSEMTQREKGLTTKSWSIQVCRNTSVAIKGDFGRLCPT